jgi:hypothetical protein
MYRGGMAVSYRENAMIARTVGVLCIASGFVLGMYGLDHPESVWLRTALGLLATGLLAQGYALYCSIQRAREIAEQKQADDARGKP